MNALKVRRMARKAAGAAPWVPVSVVPGDQPPKQEGSSHGYETKGGTPIAHPNAYSKKGWSNMVYRSSTIQVIVGSGWLRQFDTTLILGCRR